MGILEIQFNLVNENKKEGFIFAEKCTFVEELYASKM